MNEHPSDELLLALALADVDPPERERLGTHLAGCAACRGEYHAIEDAVGATLDAAPSVAPPAGFSGRVVAAMELASGTGGNGVGAGAGAGGGAGTARPSPSRWLLVGAGLAVGLVVGVAATLGVQTLQAPVVPDPAPASSAQPTPGVHEASALVTRTGQTVGTVGHTVLGGKGVLVVAVTAGRPGMTYECVVVASDGSRTSGGRWTLEEGYGSRAGVGAGTWVVELGTGDVARVELVAPSGAVWSRASF